MDASAYAQELAMHARNPVGRQRPENIIASAERRSRVCGDQIELFLSSESGKSVLFFEGKGCMLLIASASILAGLSRKFSFQECRLAGSQLVAALKDEIPDYALPVELQPLLDIRRFPARHQCVLLPWMALAGLQE